MDNEEDRGVYKENFYLKKVVHLLYRGHEQLNIDLYSLCYSIIISDLKKIKIV